MSHLHDSGLRRDQTVEGRRLGPAGWASLSGCTGTSRTTRT